MKNEIDRRSFLGSLLIVPIVGLLEFKQQTILKPKINWRSIKDDLPNLYKFCEEFMVSKSVLIKYGIREDRQLVRIGRVWDDGEASGSGYWEDKSSDWNLPNANSWAYKSELFKISELSWDQKKRFLSCDKRNGSITHFRIISGVLVPYYWVGQSEGKSLVV